MLRTALATSVVLSVALLVPLPFFTTGAIALADGGTDRPHIVLFLSDDHGYRDSGAYGDSNVRTPNIDRLAREGMRFTHAFAASPLCSPSRCVIETGLMPHRNGAHKFGTPITTDVPTMPEHFKRLFDLRSDPFEMRNLADNPEQAELLDSLRGRLLQWCKTQGDQAGVTALSD